MNQRQYLIRGTILLTTAGMITRTAGFFYKIFLSRTIGAKEIGLFQLTAPIFSLCMAIACGGIQTALSRFTSEYHAKKDPASSRRILLCALFFTTVLSSLCTFLILLFSKWIAAVYLMEADCEPVLQIIAWSLPFAVIHSCISGYFIGLKNITVSAFSQLTEQMSRIITVFIFYCIFLSAGHSIDACTMALGQLAGELVSSIYCMYYLCFAKKNSYRISPETLHGSIPVSYQKAFCQLLSISLPLGLNRILMCVLHSMEAALLPQKLQHFGLNSHTALASYGILTGMSLPLILFPTAVTSAISTLLLPAVSEAQTLHQAQKIRNSIRTGIAVSLSMGLFFMLLFLLSGTYIGTFLFDNQEAGTYIRFLAISCPFLYLNTTLISTIHGLGKSSSVFVWNIAGFLFRLASVIFLVELWGINGYLLGTVFSQIFLSCCICWTVRSYLFSSK